MSKVEKGGCSLKDKEKRGVEVGGGGRFLSFVFCDLIAGKGIYLMNMVFKSGAPIGGGIISASG